MLAVKELRRITKVGMIRNLMIKIRILVDLKLLNTSLTSYSRNISMEQ